MSEPTWIEPVAGFEFEPENISVTEEFQSEKLAACGLNSEYLNGYVDASFFIAIGIHAGIHNGISAEGNVNMLTSLVQHRPVDLGEALTVRGSITEVIDVPRGQTIKTDVWFEDQSGKRAISAPRMSLRPNPNLTTAKGAGTRPAPVIEKPEALKRYCSYELTPEKVKTYSSEGNSIHYDMEAANKAGFRAPIIGGGMGVHFMVHALWQNCTVNTFDLSIYFRRPIFWDDQFVVAADPWNAIALVSGNSATGFRNGKILTEARINNMS